MKRREFLQGTSSAAVAAPLASLLLSRQALAAPPKIKIGQIGTKHAHAGGKMQTIRKFDHDYELVGVVEPDDEKWKAVQNSGTYRGVKRLSEEALLGTAGLQAVAVETEVRDLVPTALRCIRAGAHIHLDKPAGESLPAFKEVLDEATSKKLVVQMGYMLRYNPAFVFLFDAVKQGWLGDVFEVHAVMSKTVGAGTRNKLAAYPGGAMFELGCHIIDAVVAVLGRPTTVTAHNRATRPEQDDLLDNCLAVFDYPRATATVRSALIEVDGFRRRQFVVCGDQGTIVIRPLESCIVELTLSQARGEYKKGTQRIELPKLGGRYDGDFLDLAKIIRGEKESDYPPAHDLAVQEAVLRASGLPTT